MNKLKVLLVLIIISLICAVDWVRGMEINIGDQINIIWLLIIFISMLSIILYAVNDTPAKPNKDKKKDRNKRRRK